MHWALDTMRWNWGHPRFHFVALPKRAAWLNLIEGFWKILGQRALAGRDCTSTARGPGRARWRLPIGIGSPRLSSGDDRPSPGASSGATYVYSI